MKRRYTFALMCIVALAAPAQASEETQSKQERGVYCETLAQMEEITQRVVTQRVMTHRDHMVAVDEAVAVVNRRLGAFVCTRGMFRYDRKTIEKMVTFSGVEVAFLRVHVIAVSALFHNGWVEIPYNAERFYAALRIAQPRDDI